MTSANHFDSSAHTRDRQWEEKTFSMLKIRIICLRWCCEKLSFFLCCSCGSCETNDDWIGLLSETIITSSFSFVICHVVCMWTILGDLELITLNISASVIALLSRARSNWRTRYALSLKASTKHYYIVTSLNFWRMLTLNFPQPS